MRRHDLVTLKKDAVVQSVSCCTTDCAELFVRQWIAEGKAFVNPRQEARLGNIQLGLAFIQNGVKHRASLQANYEDILRGNPPLELSDCLDMFKREEAIVLGQLIEKLELKGLSLYVFGSVAWEKITGTSYRTDKSDLDLLCDVATMEDLRFVTNAFVEAERALPFCIDGELRFPNDDCVNWLEGLSALDHPDGMEVLVKGESGVYMGTMNSLLEPVHA